MKELKKLQKSVNEGSFIPMADLSEKGKFGKNFPMEVCCQVARRCRFEQPEKHTAAGCHCTGITELVSSDVEVPSAEILLSSRHKSIDMSARYQSGNKNAHTKRYHATMFSDQKKGMYCLLFTVTSYFF